MGFAGNGFFEVIKQLKSLTDNSGIVISSLGFGIGEGLQREAFAAQTLPISLSSVNIVRVHGRFAFASSIEIVGLVLQWPLLHISKEEAG